MSIYKKVINSITYGPLRPKFVMGMLALIPGYVQASLNQIFKSMPPGGKQIIFFLEDQKFYEMGDGNSRYLYLIMNRFSEAGYKVYFYKKIDFRAYYRLEKLGRLIFKIRNLKVLSQLPKNTEDFILAFDSIDQNFLQKKWKKLVYVNAFRPPFCQIGPMVWIPYFMYPVTYRIGQHKLIGSHRSSERKIKMIFAGNTNKKYYNNSKLRNRYGQLTRLEGLEALLQLGPYVKCGQGSDLFKYLLNAKDYINECNILMTNTTFPISFADWFKLMARSDFFVCLSGTDMPMCHNAVEAIGVGTIPIISYPGWFFPPLEHGKNAILYSGKDDLMKKVQEVLNMPAEQIRKIRANAIEYYEQHLTTESFIQKFESQKEGIFTIMLHPKLVCSQEEEERGKKIYEDLQSRFGADSTNDIERLTQEDTKLKASIIIPTFGTRPDYLQDVLATAKTQNFPKDEYEILVIDNHPENSVLPIVEAVNRECLQGPVVQYTKESVVGLSEARNAGAQKAKADIVIYIGDDVLLNPDWLGAIVEPFRDPKVGCSGGKLIAKWEAPIPEWFSQLKHMALGMLDLGDKTLELKGQQVWGDNMAVRKSVLFEVGGFNPDIYGYGDKRLIWHSGDGECGLEKKIYQHKYKIVYEPRAWVYHRVPMSRTTEDYFYKRTFVSAIGSSYSQVRKMRSARFLSPRLFLQSCYYFFKAGWLFLASSCSINNRITIRTFAYKFYAKAHHQLRASFNKQLREHIFRESYLERKV